MRFETFADVEQAVTKAESIGLTQREKNIVIKEFGEVLSKENTLSFTYDIDGTFFFGHTDRYLYEKCVNAKFETFVNLMKIDTKLGLFNNDDSVILALCFFAYDILEKSSLVQKLLVGTNSENCDSLVQVKF